jgi:hypothetical protein
MPDYHSIVTHNDFDGLGSAALLSWAFDLDHIRFAGPISIANAEISIAREDIVCDLPCPVECGMWFDHHAGNLEELRLRGIDAHSIPGRFAVAPSCVRVVFDYLRETDDLPEDYAELTDAADLIDSFSFPNLDAWRADTPANRIDRALKATGEDRREQEQFMRELVFQMRDLSLSEIAKSSDIRQRAQRYVAEEERMLEILQRYGKLYPDAQSDLFVVDTTGFLQPARLDKKLIGLVEPRAHGYVELKPVFRMGKKTNDVAVSLSLSLSIQKAEHHKDMSEIVRVLNVGDGHAGAAAGVFHGASPRDFQKVRAEARQRIWELWSKQK